MSGLVNPGGASGARASSAHVRELKDVVRSTLKLQASTTVMIQQLACTESDCPPVETIVAVLESPRRSWKFSTPTEDLPPSLLRDTLVANPEGLDHDKRD